MRVNVKILKGPDCSPIVSIYPTQFCWSQSPKHRTKLTGQFACKQTRGQSSHRLVNSRTGV